MFFQGVTVTGKGEKKSFVFGQGENQGTESCFQHLKNGLVKLSGRDPL